MEFSRLKASIWILISFFALSLVVFSVIIWYVVIGDYLILNPQLGTWIFSGVIVLISILIYEMGRLLKSIRDRRNSNPHLFYKALAGLLIILFFVQIPVGYESYDRWMDSFDYSSPYDSNFGDQLVPDAQGTIFSSISGISSHHGSNVVNLPNGDLFAVWYGGSGEKKLDVAIYASRCTPENVNEDGEWELTWSEPVVVADTPNKSEGNPVLYQCPNGTLVMFYHTLRSEGLYDTPWGPIIPMGWSLAKIKMISSNDYGYTWSDPIYLRDDYYWVLRTPAVQISSGKVILPFYREALQYQSFFYINDDPNLGGEWHVEGRLRTPHGCLQPAIVELDSGRLFCALRTTDGRIYQSYSYDEGSSWAIPSAMRFPNPNSQVSLLKLNNGNILMLCNPLSNGRGVLSLILGNSNADSWSEPQWILKDFSKSFSYPSMIQLPDNSIVFTYSNNRQNIGWCRFNSSIINSF